MLRQRHGCRIAWTGTKDNSLWLSAAFKRSKCPDTASFCKIAGHYSGLIVVVDRQFYMLILIQSELTCLFAAGPFSLNILDS